MPTETGGGVFRRVVRWMYGSMARGVIFSCAFVLLLAVGYLRLMNAISGESSHGCPRAASDLHQSALPGRYTGTGGMEIDLVYGRPSAPEGQASFEVRNWRYSDYEHGDDSSGSFDGSGSWEYEPRSGVKGMQIRLDFDEGPQPGKPAPISFLVVGGGGRPVLFDDVDPDVCPDIVMNKSD
ncbi:hypothetical protein ACFV1F_18465 [Streptomyces sp. NPDC059590]|uniref:hypothetical protein n=1 Tax=Streptomyces sp. NPDC059590 TaxID=3346877 RepID=UPI00368C896F